MVSRRSHSKDISLILKNFAGINFRESIFSGVKKEISFREFGQTSRKILPAKISTLKVVYILVGKIFTTLSRGLRFTAYPLWAVVNYFQNVELVQQIFLN